MEIYTQKKKEKHLKGNHVDAQSAYTADTPNARDNCDGKWWGIVDDDSNDLNVSDIFQTTKEKNQFDANKTKFHSKKRRKWKKRQMAIGVRDANCAAPNRFGTHPAPDVRVCVCLVLGVECKINLLKWIFQ